MNRLIKVTIPVLALMSPIILSSAWLSDKTQDAGFGSISSKSVPQITSSSSSQAVFETSSSQAPIRSMRRGFFTPLKPVSDWPWASLLKTSYDPNSDSVLIRWQGSNGEKTPRYRYAIYRGASYLSDENRLDQAERIGLTEPGVFVFEDQNALDGENYYAISVIDEDNTEFFRPLLDQNFSYDALTLESGLPIVNNLAITYDTDKQALNLTWEEARNSAQDLIYHLYQSDKPIANLLGAQELGRVDHPATNYSVIAPQDGSFFYAVVSKTKAGRSSKEFKAGQNTTANPLLIETKYPAKTLPPQVSGLKAIYDPRARILSLNWKYRDLTRPGLIIYHNETAPITLKANLNASSKIHLVRSENDETGFNYASPKPGNHFFSILSFNEHGTNTALFPGENTLDYPTIVPYPDVVIQQTNYVLVYITNQKIINFVQTNTNLYLLALTNRQEVNAWRTNYRVVEEVRYITNDRLIYSDKTITNHLKVTNTEFITNYESVTLTNIRYLTNTQVIDDGPQESLKPGLEDEILELRSLVKFFFKSRDSSDRSGMYESIIAFRKLQSDTKDGQIASQCVLFAAQAYYHLGDYSTAFREFYKLQSIFPEESRGWMNRCIERMK